jgi:hypothetical protein
MCRSRRKAETIEARQPSSFRPPTQLREFGIPFLSWCGFKGGSVKTFLFFVSLFGAVAAYPVETDNEAFYGATCVKRCVQRSINGMCLNYGRDFCAKGPGVACIPHCVQRSIHKSCLNHGMDFCGNYPECIIRCERTAVTGQCLQYGPDACFSN